MSAFYWLFDFPNQQNKNFSRPEAMNEDLLLDREFPTLYKQANIEHREQKMNGGKNIFSGGEREEKK